MNISACTNYWCDPWGRNSHRELHEQEQRVPDKAGIVHKFLYWSNSARTEFLILEKQSTFNGEIVNKLRRLGKAIVFYSNSFEKTPISPPFF